MEKLKISRVLHDNMIHESLKDNFMKSQLGQRCNLHLMLEFKKIIDIQFEFDRNENVLMDIKKTKDILKNNYIK